VQALAERQMPAGVGPVQVELTRRQTGTDGS
jgi:hypothetical protein